MDQTPWKLQPPPVHIDSTQLTTWRACRRKYLWSVIYALYPMGKSVHLIAGAAVAAGLEAVRRFIFTHPKPESIGLEDMLSVAWEPFRAEWGDYIIPATDQKSFVNTFNALRAYLVEFDPRFDPIQPYRRPDGSPAVEYTFAIPTGISHPSGGEFLFTGRFDLLGLYNELPVVVDEKTTSAIGFTWANQFELRGQFMGYVWACQQVGLQLDTAVVRGVGIMKSKEQNATAILQFTPAQISRWERQMRRDVIAIANTWEELNAYIAPKEHPGTITLVPPRLTEGDLEELYPYNFADSCTSYGGCAFLDLCKSARPEVYFNNYVRHVWDPLARQPVKEVASNAS